MTDQPITEVTNTAEPIFVLEIAPEVPSLSPRSYDELIEWLAKERSYWSWVTNLTNIPDLARQNFNDQQCIGWANALKGQSGVPEKQQAVKELLDNLLGSLRKRYQSIRALHSASPRAKFLETITDPVIRGHALRAFLGQPPVNPADTNSFRGAVLAYMYEAGTVGVPESYTKSLVELQQRISGEHEALRRHLGEMGDKFLALTENIEKLHVKQSGDFGTAEGLREEAFTKLVNDSRTRMADVERAFEQKTATKSTVAYFKSKATKHSFVAAGAGILAVGIGIVFGSYALFQADQFLAETPPKPARIAVAVLLATLGFWLLRLVVRALLSQMHLATDCRSRAMLMETYIALLKDGGAIKDDDRKIILGVLFRPMSDGLIRDDGAPPGLWDILTRSVSGK